MFAFNHDKVAKSTSYILDDIGSTFFAPLVSIGEALRRCKIFLWLQEEKLRYTTVRELDRLNDDYLDDIGIKKRSDIRPIANALVRHRREKQDRPKRS